MTQLRKERLEEIRDYDTCVTLEESAEMARRLLAAEEQQPVAWEVKGILCHSLDEEKRYVGEPEPLYLHPQQGKAVQVPDEVNSAIERLRRALVSCNRYNYCSNAVKGVEEACRAAMLHGSETVQDLPENAGSAGKCRSSEKEQVPDEIDTHDPALDTHRKWMAEGWNRCRAAMLTSEPVSSDELNYPAIPDGWVVLPAEPTQAMMNAWLSEVANWRGHAAGYRAMIAAAPKPEVK